MKRNIFALLIIAAFAAQSFAQAPGLNAVITSGAIVRVALAETAAGPVDDAIRARRTT